MTKSTIWVILGFIVGLIIVVVYMAFFPKSAIKRAPESTLVDFVEVEGEPENEEEEITIKMSEYMYSPAVVTIDSGDSYNLKLKNFGFTNHNFVIDELDIYSTTVSPGKEEVISITVDEPGEYTFYCSISDHRDNGMEGVLIVK